MSRHTPGPWEYGEAANYFGYYIAPEGTLPTLAAVERCGEDGLRVQAHNFPGALEANARLIAAAPELLEAAKGALARYPELNKLRAAVEKAEAGQ